MGQSHDHGTIGGISQDPIGIEIKGIDMEHDRSGAAIVKEHVIVTKVMGHMVASHDSENKEI